MKKKSRQAPASISRRAANGAGTSPFGEPSLVDRWNLRLYVAGQTPKSLTALTNLRKLCDEHLRGRYELEVVDLLRNPQLAQNDQIVAIPTLVRKLPPPIRRVIGDLSNRQRVLAGMDLWPVAS